MRQGIKYVKNANLWSLTTFHNDKQTIKWFNTKDEAVKESIEEAHKNK